VAVREDAAQIPGVLRSGVDVRFRFHKELLFATASVFVRKPVDEAWLRGAAHFLLAAA
jgi:hypothetical protein